MNVKDALEEKYAKMREQAKEHDCLNKSGNVDFDSFFDNGLNHHAEQGAQIDWDARLKASQEIFESLQTQKEQTVQRQDNGLKKSFDDMKFIGNMDLTVTSIPNNVHSDWYGPDVSDVNHSSKPSDLPKANRSENYTKYNERVQQASGVSVERKSNPSLLLNPTVGE